MNELNLSTYIQTMQAGFMNNRSQEAAATLLLNAINNLECVAGAYGYTDLSSKKISNIVSRKAPVPDNIVKASTNADVIIEVIRYFQNSVLPDLNPHLHEDTIANVVNLIDKDDSISPAKKRKLLQYLDRQQISEFLAQVFLYAVNRPNVKRDATVQYEDAPLLAEANYKCPLNHEDLVETVKGKPVKRYRVTQIFPDDLSDEQEKVFEAIYPKPTNPQSQDNLIVLCERCSEAYLANPTVEEYKKLREIKTQISRSYKMRVDADRVDLEDDIRVVLNALMNIYDKTELVELEYNALRIDEKIKPEFFILRNETQMQVLNYYRFIESVFSKSEVDFDSIATEIRLCSRKMEKSGMNQEEVVCNLAEWIRRKADLPEGKLFACNIVVAFFIQNCEVFHK